MTNDEYFKSQEFKDILHVYEKGKQEGVSIYLDPNDLADIAEYYHLQGQIDKSVALIDEAINLFPGSSAPLIFRARIELLVNNDPFKAEEFAEQVEDKTDLEYHYLKTEIMLVRHQDREADRFLLDCLGTIDESDREDFYIDVATLFADYDLIDKAHEWLMRSQLQDSDNYQELTGRIALAKGDYMQSQHIFNDLVEKNPYSGSYWNHLASSQYMSNEIRESITSSEFSIAINPNDDEAILNKANGLFALGNYEEALLYYRRLTDMCPKEETGEMFQGITFIKLNRLKEAVEHLKQAEEIAGRDSETLPDIYQTLAYTFSSLGESQQAMAYIKKAEQALGANLNELSVLRGHLLMGQGEVERARESYQKAIYDSDFDPDIILRAAISIYENNYIELAYGFLHTLLGIGETGRTDGYSYLAACCKELGKDSEYKKALKKACERNPVEVRAVLGENIPSTLDPSEYYHYLIEHTDKQ